MTRVLLIFFHMKNEKYEFVKENYPYYQSFMESPKYVKSPISIDRTKENHPQSLYYEVDLDCTNPVFSNAKLLIEVTNGCRDKYSASIISDGLQGMQLFRLDTKGGAHVNGFDTSIPLSERKVTVPHFHQFNEDGYMFAYKTEELRGNSTDDFSLNVEFGLSLFFEKAHIYDKETGQIPTFSIA